VQLKPDPLGGVQTLIAGKLMRVEGRCHCGEISYEATVDRDNVAICHCTDCEMLTGSAYRVTVPAAAADFELKKGEPRRYVKVADSGAERVHAFCPDCGSPIYSSAVADPERYSLRVGCLKQRAELVPRRQQWCDSALPWAMDLSPIPKRARQ
jgi:hypothetical protein